jgi:hypothetical protein
MVEFLGCTDHWFYIKECFLSSDYLLHLSTLHRLSHFLREAAFYLVFISLKQAYDFSVCTFPVSEITVWCLQDKGKELVTSAQSTAYSDSILYEHNNHEPVLFTRIKVTSHWDLTVEGHLVDNSFCAFALLPSHSLGISVNKSVCCGPGRRRILNHVTNIRWKALKINKLKRYI